MYASMFHPMINVRRIVLAETAKESTCPSDWVDRCAQICGVPALEVRRVLASAFRLRKVQSARYLALHGWAG